MVLLLAQHGERLAIRADGGLVIARLALYVGQRQQRKAHSQTIAERRAIRGAQLTHLTRAIIVRLIERKNPGAERGIRPARRRSSGSGDRLFQPAPPLTQIAAKEPEAPDGRR